MGTCATDLQGSPEKSCFMEVLDCLQKGSQRRLAHTKCQQGAE